MIRMFENNGSTIADLTADLSSLENKICSLKRRGRTHFCPISNDKETWNWYPSVNA